MHPPRRMTAAEAKAELTLITDASTEPVISSEDLDIIVAKFKIADDDGLSPTDDDWAGKYQLDLAAAMVFEIKAARVATHFDFSADGSRFNRAQKEKHFQDLAQKHRNRVNVSFEPDIESSGSDIAEVESYVE